MEVYAPMAMGCIAIAAHRSRESSTVTGSSREGSANKSIGQTPHNTQTGSNREGSVNEPIGQTTHNAQTGSSRESSTAAARDAGADAGPAHTMVPPTAAAVQDANVVKGCGATDFQVIHEIQCRNKNGSLIVYGGHMERLRNMTWTQILKIVWTYPNCFPRPGLLCIDFEEFVSCQFDLLAEQRHSIKNRYLSSQGKLGRYLWRILTARHTWSLFETVVVLGEVVFDVAKQKWLANMWQVEIALTNICVLEEVQTQTTDSRSLPIQRINIIVDIFRIVDMKSEWADQMPCEITNQSFLIQSDSFHGFQ